MAYIVILNTYFLNKDGEASVKLIKLPKFHLYYGTFDTIEETKSKIEERIKDFKNERLYYCDALDECVVFDSFECIGDNTSYILKYSGCFFNKGFSLKINGNNNGHVDVIEEYYINECKVTPFDMD